MLVLIKVLLITDLINEHEAETMKIFVIGKPDQAKGLIAPFLTHHALDKFRENFRGLLGLPRTKAGDSSRYSQSSSHTLPNQRSSKHDDFGEATEKI